MPLSPRRLDSLPLRQLPLWPERTTKRHSHRWRQRFHQRPHPAAGDVGTVVHAYSDDGAYEVEFVAAAGETVAVLTLTDADVRPTKGQEILHARLLPAV